MDTCFAKAGITCVAQAGNQVTPTPNDLTLLILKSGIVPAADCVCVTPSNCLSACMCCCAASAAAALTHPPCVACTVIIAPPAHQKAASACTSAAKLSEESTTWVPANAAGAGPAHRATVPLSERTVLLSEETVQQTTLSKGVLPPAQRRVPTCVLVHAGQHLSELGEAGDCQAVCCRVASCATAQHSMSTPLEHLSALQ